LEHAAFLECHHLVKRYGDATVVDDLSFAIHPGECLGVIGPNGAGKTTTLRMCLGLTEPDAGEVRAFGLRMPQDAHAIKAQIGVVTQFDSLDPDFSCAENLLVFGRYFGLKASAIRERIPALLEFAALTHKADAKPGQLSGGMRRRLSLARALVNDPRLLLLDEPTAGMSPEETITMMDLIVQLAAERTVILVEHKMKLVMGICQRLIVLHHGELLAEGTPEDIRANDEVRRVYLGQGNP